MRWRRFCSIMCLLYSTLLYSSASASNIQAYQSQILPRITQVTYQKLNSTDPASRQVLPLMCLTNQTQYKLKLVSHSSENVFRVPHARIFEDSQPCGDQRIPKESLWVQKHMVLAPYWMMNTTKAAREGGNDAVGMQFAFQAKFRAHLQHAAKEIEALVDSKDIWVGYESGDRVCGGKVSVKAGTFILFARTPEDTPELLGKLSMVFHLHDPSKVDTVYSIADTTYVFQKVTDIHLAFREVQTFEANDYDMICPFALSEYQRADALGKNEGRESGSSCFPGNAVLTQESGSSVKMSQLQIGDKVLDAEGKYTDIFLFTHRDENSFLHEFVELTTEDASNSKLTISPSHYAYTSAGLKPAGEVQIGMSLIDSRGKMRQVIGKRFVLREGLYNPQTISGSLAVNGFAVSTYTTAIRPSTARFLLRPVREIYWRSSRTSFVRKHLLSNVFTKGAGKFDWLVVATFGVPACVRTSNEMCSPSMKESFSATLIEAFGSYSSLWSL